jgi:hypothetical protein
MSCDLLVLIGHSLAAEALLRWLGELFMATMRTRLLLGGATLLNGILAGGVIDRVIVAGPAWRELGAKAWVQYSQHADLGNGLFAYPVEAIGGAVLILAATLSNYFDRNANRIVMISLCSAVMFSLFGLILTAKAAPIMLSLASPQPAGAMQYAFDEFLLWGLYLRGTADILTFVVLIWAFANLDHRTRQPGSNATKA